MLRILIGIFLVLHGLVHLWYVVLSQRLVAFQPEMGWSGRSFLYNGLMGSDPSRTLASVLYAVAAVAFVVGGAGLFVRADWWRALAVGAALFSSVVILFFFDGELNLLVEKGLLGIAINLIILAVLLFTRWPPAGF